MYEQSLLLDVMGISILRSQFLCPLNIFKKCNLAIGMSLPEYMGNTGLEMLFGYSNKAAGSYIAN